MNYIDALAHQIQQSAEDGAPMSEGDMPLYRIYAVLALAKGEATTAADVHDAWAAWTAGNRPWHKSLVPFSQLTPEVQALDEPYVRAIREVGRGQK